jgi:hypothetical protein
MNGTVSKGGCNPLLQVTGTFINRNLLLSKSELGSIGLNMLPKSGFRSATFTFDLTFIFDRTHLNLTLYTVGIAYGR